MIERKERGEKKKVWDLLTFQIWSHHCLRAFHVGREVFVEDCFRRTFEEVGWGLSGHGHRPLSSSSSWLCTSYSIQVNKQVNVADYRKRVMNRRVTL